MNGRGVCLVECCFWDIDLRQGRHRSKCDYREQRHPKPSRHSHTPIAEDNILGPIDCQPNKAGKKPEAEVIRKSIRHAFWARAQLTARTCLRDSRKRIVDENKAIALKTPGDHNPLHVPGGLP